MHVFFMVFQVTDYKSVIVLANYNVFQLLFMKFCCQNNFGIIRVFFMVFWVADYESGFRSAKFIFF